MVSRLVQFNPGNHNVYPVRVLHTGGIGYNQGDKTEEELTDAVSLLYRKSLLAFRHAHTDSPLIGAWPGVLFRRDSISSLNRWLFISI